jgi:peptidoglycan hydrolase CwlO-like protein
MEKLINWVVILRKINSNLLFSRKKNQSNISSDLEREFNEKQSNVQLLEKEVAEGRKRCGELEEELDQVNKEIGEARVRLFLFFE